MSPPPRGHSTAVMYVSVSSAEVDLMHHDYQESRINLYVAQLFS